VIYEWDAAKASANLRKHKVSFAEAASVFLDPLALSFFDPDHSDEEDREKRALFVSHYERGERIRIISARKATRKERLQYEKNISKESR